MATCTSEYYLLTVNDRKGKKRTDWYFMAIRLNKYTLVYVRVTSPSKGIVTILYYMSCEILAIGYEVPILDHPFEYV